MTNPSTTTPLVVVNTTRTFEAACRALEAAIPAHGFGLLGILDIGDTLRRKGMAFAEQCHIFEVCQPQQAARVLAADLRLNMALPCRLSVYTEAGATKIGMISPVALLAGLSSEPELQVVAAEVDATARAIIDTAAAPGNPD
jgi:uncharacterized protein (DUF302 family)